MRNKSYQAEASDFWKLLVYRLKYPFKIWLFEVIDQLVLHQPLPKAGSPAVLLTRLDLIGDYLMCRPFFKALKDSPDFSGKKFILAANQVYAPLAEFLDSDAIDQFIWIDRARFINSIAYRYRILKQIRALNASVCVNLSHTRQYFNESICRVSGAQTRVRPESVGVYMSAFEQAIADSWYHCLIQTGQKPAFEFIRNRRFFLALAPGMSAPRHLKTLVSFPLPDVDLPDRFIALAPGASSPHRRWPVEKFRQLAGWIGSNLGWPLVVLGAGPDFDLGEQCKSNSATVLNLCGKLSLPESLAVLQKARVLVSNESAPVHMAATVGTPVFCLSQGNHFGRWNPYPHEVDPGVFTIYPPKFYPLEQNWNELLNRYHLFSDYPIEEIEIQQVVEGLQGLLKL